MAKQQQNYLFPDQERYEKTKSRFNEITTEITGHMDTVKANSAFLKNSEPVNRQIYKDFKERQLLLDNIVLQEKSAKALADSLKSIHELVKEQIDCGVSVSEWEAENRTTTTPLNGEDQRI